MLNKKEKTDFYVVSITLAAVAAALLLMRIVVNLINTALIETGIPEWETDMIIDLIFTSIVQIGICFALPLLIYRFALKKSFKRVFAFSNFRKTKPINYLLVILIGIVAFFVSSGISSIWISTLSGFGYTYTSSSSSVPVVFNVGYFLLTLFLTAVLPAFCEEFLNRGGFLTVLRERFSTLTVILLCGLEFGLFHANIDQVFYTACFGMLLAFVVIKTGSIFPAMIIHFLNNGISVVISFIDDYAPESFLQSFNVVFGGIGFLIAFMISIPILVLLLLLLSRVNAETPGAVEPKPLRRVIRIDPYTGVVTDSMDNISRTATVDIDPFDGGPAPSDIDPFDGTPCPKQTTGRTIYSNSPFISDRQSRNVWIDEKWTRRKGSGIKKTETAFWIGAIVISSLATVFSLIWGFMI